MHLSTSIRRLPTWAAALAVCALCAGAIPASASAPQVAKAENTKGCIQINLIELTEKVYGNIIPSTPVLPAGFMGIWFDQLNSPTGTTAVGSASGAFDIMYQRPSDGHDIEYLTDQAQIADGTFMMTGTFDRSEMLAGHWINLSARGTSGRYRGMSGTWSWRILSFTAPGFPGQDIINLCARD